MKKRWNSGLFVSALGALLFSLSTQAEPVWTAEETYKFFNVGGQQVGVCEARLLNAPAAPNLESVRRAEAWMRLLRKRLEILATACYPLEQYCPSIKTLEPIYQAIVAAARDPQLELFFVNPDGKFLDEPTPEQLARIRAAGFDVKPGLFDLPGSDADRTALSFFSPGPILVNTARIADMDWQRILSLLIHEAGHQGGVKTDAESERTLDTLGAAIAAFHARSAETQTFENVSLVSLNPFPLARGGFPEVSDDVLPLFVWDDGKNVFEIAPLLENLGTIVKDGKFVAQWLAGLRLQNYDAATSRLHFAVDAFTVVGDVPRSVARSTKLVSADMRWNFTVPAARRADGKLRLNSSTFVARLDGGYLPFREDQPAQGSLDQVQALDVIPQGDESLQRVQLDFTASHAPDRVMGLFDVGSQVPSAYFPMVEVFDDTTEIESLGGNRYRAVLELKFPQRHFNPAAKLGLQEIYLTFPQHEKAPLRLRPTARSWITLPSTGAPSPAYERTDPVQQWAFSMGLGDAFYVKPGEWVDIKKIRSQLAFMRLWSLGFPFRSERPISQFFLVLEFEHADGKRSNHYVGSSSTDYAEWLVSADCKLREEAGPNDWMMNLGLNIDKLPADVVRARLRALRFVVGTLEFDEIELYPLE